MSFFVLVLGFDGFLLDQASLQNLLEDFQRDRSRKRPSEDQTAPCDQ
jgi:hypothetical protein